MGYQSYCLCCSGACGGICGILVLVFHNVDCKMTESKSGGQKIARPLLFLNEFFRSYNEELFGPLQKGENYEKKRIKTDLRSGRDSV